MGEEGGMLRKLLKGGTLLTCGAIVTHIFLLLRSIFIAKLIGAKEMGVAALLGLTVILLELMSNLNIEKLIIQASDGNEEEFQGTAQLIQPLSGFAGAIIVYAIAGPLSSLFSIPETKWAFQAICIIPLIRGFQHIDFQRIQRELNYWPQVIVETSSQAVESCQE